MPKPRETAREFAIRLRKIREKEMEGAGDLNDRMDRFCAYVSKWMSEIERKSNLPPEKN